MLTFGSMMKQNSLKYGEKPAVIFQNVTYTYRQLNERANRVANAFTERGFKKGDKVAVFMKNHSAYIEIIVGLSKIGVVIVPINYRLVGSEIDYIVNHSDSKGIILTAEYVEEIRTLLPTLTQIEVALVVGDNISEDKMLDYEMALNGASADEPQAEVDEADPLYIGYTSGTTGKPKGVVISHRSRMLTGIVSAYEYKIDESDVHLVAGPIYHAAPWIFLMMQLIVGGTLVIHESFHADEVLRDIEKYKITNTFLAPTMYTFLVNETGTYDLSSIRVLISAGAPLATKTKMEILNFFKDADLHEFYGSTESAITLNIKPKDIKERERSVGHPFPFVECLILDEEKKPVADGEVGELYFKAPYLLDEYYKNPEATAESFYGKYFSVGDMAVKDGEGFYYIVDRKKDMLISGGVNIYPREIEEVLYTHPDILDVAVIGVPDPVWGESVKAIIVQKADATLTEADVISYCEGRMASYKKPKSVNFIDQLPRNPSGKVLKTELRAQYWQDEQTKI